MKIDTVSHILSCLDYEYKNVLDLSLPNQEHNTLIFEKFLSTYIEYNQNLDNKIDCVLYFGEYSKDILSVFENAKKALIDSGVFIVSLISDLNDWNLITLFRANGFKINDVYFDKSELNKEHVFVLQKSKSKENKIIKFIPETTCNQATVKCNIPNGNGLSDCCLSHLYELLDEISITFSNNNIKYWLDGGTLLGAARDGSIIPWDRNANIGILATDIPKIKEINKQLLLKGYYLNGLRDKMTINYSKKNLISIRLYSYVSNSKLLRYGDYAYDIDYFSPLDVVKLNGKQYPCPNNLYKFLCEQYGNNWEIPSNSLGPVTY